MSTGEASSAQVETHLDLNDDDDLGIDYGTGVRLAAEHFPEAIDPAGWQKVLDSQKPVRTMIRKEYPEQEWMFVGYNGHPLYVKTDYIVTLPESIYMQLKQNNKLNQEVIRAQRRMQHALMHPEEAPWAPGQGPKSE
jgi:ABC-type proline/glycine betaine transport system substrate-binding protein